LLASLLSRRIPRLLAAGLLLACALSAPSFAAEATLDLRKHRGKVVVVDFWASWCVPCRRSFPWLNAMRQKYGDRGLVIVGVNVDRERRDADGFLAETPATFDIVFDPAGHLPKEYGVMGMPSSFVFDREGRLVARHVGFQNGKRDEYESVLRNALNGRTQ
jgi:cytochrome c biogenesis protein CcmG/thiol:disulfide interchange protein DsbE